MPPRDANPTPSFGGFGLSRPEDDLPEAGDWHEAFERLTAERAQARSTERAIGTSEGRGVGEERAKPGRELDELRSPNVGDRRAPEGDNRREEFETLRRQAAKAGRSAPPDKPYSEDPGATLDAGPAATPPARVQKPASPRSEESDSEDWHEAFEQLAAQRGVSARRLGPSEGEIAAQAGAGPTEASPGQPDAVRPAEAGVWELSASGSGGTAVKAPPATGLGRIFRFVANSSRDVLEGLGMAGRREITTVTVEHGYIKILVSRRLEVLDYRVVPVTPQLFREGLISDTVRTATLLKSTLHEMERRSRRVIGGVPGYQTTLRRLDLPKARGLDPKVIIPREARRSMGISPENSSLTWKRLPGGFDMTRWLVLSATNRSISTISAVAEAAGLSLVAMELRPLALARAVNQPDAICAWTAADGCDAVIIRDWAPVAHQAAHWGAGTTVESRDLVNRVTEVVESTIAAYEEQGSERALLDDIPVYVSGSPIGREHGIVDQVAANLRRPAGELQPPLELPRDFPVDDLIVNIGLALRAA